jgi:hypothetical protein
MTDLDDALPLDSVEIQAIGEPDVVSQATLDELAAVLRAEAVNVTQLLKQRWPTLTFVVRD